MNPVKVARGLGFVAGVLAATLFWLAVSWL